MKSWENLPTSPVSCSHFTLGNPKQSFSILLVIRTSDYLHYLSTSRSRHSRASAPWDTPLYQSWHVASQQSWIKSSRLPYTGYDARTGVSSTNPWYGCVAIAACWDMVWISTVYSGRCNYQWRESLEACVQAECGHFEHLRWSCLPDSEVSTHRTNIWIKTIYL